MLPNYCIYTQIFRDRVPKGNDQAAIQRMYAQLGPTFHALHHYCWGLMKTNRALLLAQDETTRQFYLRDSLGEFDFVIQRASADFILLPEILSKKGQNLIRLGEGNKGIVEFERAIELKPEYWPPYGHLSDYYKSTGNLKLARHWLTTGLAVSPGAKGLTSRLSELDSPTPLTKGQR
ncbi:MAG: tetratricopeptide repeat protein [Burkholderiales bacterium]